MGEAFAFFHFQYCYHFSKMIDFSWHAARVIVVEEGFAGLYRGILPSYLKVIPTVSLTWLSYEVIKKWFGVTKPGKRNTRAESPAQTAAEQTATEPVVAPVDSNNNKKEQ